MEQRNQFHQHTISIIMLIILSFFILMVWISSTMIILHLQYFYNNHWWTRWFYGGFVCNHVSWGTSLTSQDFPLLTLATIDKIVLLLAYIWHSTTHQCIDRLFLQQSEVAKIDTDVRSAFGLLDTWIHERSHSDQCIFSDQLKDQLKEFLCKFWTRPWHCR